jgi:hypothetical protein
MSNPLFSIVNQYPNEVKKTTRTKSVIYIKSKDKTKTQNDIEKELKKQKFSFYRKKDSALSGSTEVTVIDYSHIVKDGIVILVFKPASGGMNETTLNSTITELAPALAFTHGYNPKSVEDFYDFLKTIDHKKSSVYVIDRDIEAGKKFVDEFPQSSKFKDKMENAMGVLKYLNEENKKNPIADVKWGYREKPAGIDSKHKGDLFLIYKNKKMLGVSLKAGDETSKEPKLNTYVNPILETLDLKQIDELRLELWKKTYKKFSANKFYYDKGQEKKEVIEKLAHLEKTDLKEYDKLYDDGLDIIRNVLTATFAKNVAKTVQYLNVAIAGKDESVPLLVIKAYGTNYKILTDEDDVAVFLPKVKKIKSYPSTTSKQDFYIELFGSGSEKLLLKFAVRTNKTGDEHKLGQFFNLAVKFNGVV